jgi:hypothetical protein
LLATLELNGDKKCYSEMLKECGTFELLLLYAGQGNGFEVFAALTDERHILCALVMLGLFGLTRWILTILVMGDIGHFLWSSSGRLVLNALRVLEMRTSLAAILIAILVYAVLDGIDLHGHIVPSVPNMRALTATGTTTLAIRLTAFTCTGLGSIRLPHPI